MIFSSISRRFKSEFVLLYDSFTRSGKGNDLEAVGCHRGTMDRLTGICRPRRSVIATLLYLLVCLSLLTTYAFWDFVETNSIKGTSLESPTSYFQPNGVSLSRGLRNVFNTAEVKAKLNNLFEIEPSIEFKALMREQEGAIAAYEREQAKKKELLEAQRVAQVAPNFTHGAFSCGSEKPICPEIDIPGLVGKRKVDLKDAPMSDSETRVFGSAAEDVKKAVKRANDMLSKKLDAAKVGNKTHVDWLFDSLIESEAIGMNKYWYLPGGHWKPMDCIPRWKVAIVIPFRDRFYHLPILLRYLIPMLQRQFLEFSFFIVEQANQELFNRAMLMNIGFLESLNFTDYDCFIIHDVDHVPLDDHNYYGCSSMPRHFVTGADRWNYKLPYDNFFGAVTGLTKGQIRLINGFPNVYWGWGGEDDEIWKRVKEVGLQISRMKGPVGHYDVIRHHHKSAPLAKDRYGLLNSFKGRFKMDGLSDIVYPNPSYTLNTLYTNVSVDIRKIKPHYPMPSVKGVAKASQDALKKKMADMAMRVKKPGGPPVKNGPGVRMPAPAPQKAADGSPPKAADSPQAEKAKEEEEKKEEEKKEEEEKGEEQPKEEDNVEKK